MAKKFHRKAFVDWLDILAKIVVKTRDEFTCQIQYDDKCSGQMQPLSRDCQWCHIKSKKAYVVRWDIINTVCGCGHCHAMTHDQPTDWFREKFPVRHDYIYSFHETKSSWKEADFRLIEQALLQKCIDLDVDWVNVPQAYRDRLRRKMEEYTY